MTLSSSDQALMLRETLYAVRHDQAFIWNRNVALGVDLGQPGGEEVLDELLFVMGHYQHQHSLSDLHRTVVPAWTQDALEHTLTHGVRLSPLVMLRLYKANNMPLLARLFACEPPGLDEMGRALLLCQAALVREEPEPTKSFFNKESSHRASRKTLRTHVDPSRRDSLFTGLVRWGLPERIVVSNDAINQYAWMLFDHRVSLSPLDGPGALTAYHTPSIVDGTVLHLADHWMAPSDVLAFTSPETVTLRRQTFSALIERAVLNTVPPLAPLSSLPSASLHPRSSSHR